MLKLIMAPDPILTQVCLPVPKVDKEIKTLGLAMMSFMLENKAIGLAAPQIGRLLKIMTIDTTGIANANEAFKGIIVNPVIMRRNHVKRKRIEKCLSFKDKEVEISRLTEITVKFRNELNKVKLETFKGITATCFQHEYDHLMGITFDKYEAKASIFNTNVGEYNVWRGTEATAGVLSVETLKNAIDTLVQRDGQFEYDKQENCMSPEEFLIRKRAGYYE